MGRPVTETADRQRWLGILARAPHDRLTQLASSFEGAIETDVLRPPEIGAVMIRGRVGGTGAPFNLGEMTVTRCSLRLATGEVGHGYVQGRSKPAARLAALVDALLQSARSEAVNEAVIGPLAAEEIARRNARARKAAATKVDFFTMVRGDD